LFDTLRSQGLCEAHVVASVSCGPCLCCPPAAAHPKEMHRSGVWGMTALYGCLLPRECIASCTFCGPGSRRWSSQSLCRLTASHNKGYVCLSSLRCHCTGPHVKPKT